MFSEYTQQVDDQTPAWVMETKAEIEACSDIDTLMNEIGPVFYYCSKITPRYCQALIKPFRSRARELCKPPSKITVVDLSNVFHSVFARGNAVKDTRERLLRIYKEVDAKKFIVVIDPPTSTLKRRELFAGYKGKRNPKPPEFNEQMQEVIQNLKAKGVQVELFDGWESDDIMASAAYRAKLLDTECILVADDKDLWQCLGGSTVMYEPCSKEYRGADWLMATHSITPQQAVDWLCLVGKNDVPGAEDIGAVLASRYLSAWGDFNGVWESRHLLTDHKRGSIEAFAKDGYWLARDLHTLRRDLAIRIWDV